MTDQEDDNAVFNYAEPGIASADAKIPRFLTWTYILCPLWGIVWWYFFWNGSYGWLDRGYWFELQRAANTTFPIENQYEVIDTKGQEQDSKRKVE